MKQRVLMKRPFFLSGVWVQVPTGRLVMGGCSRSPSYKFKSSITVAWKEKKPEMDNILQVVVYFMGSNPASIAAILLRYLSTLAGYSRDGNSKYCHQFFFLCFLQQKYNFSTDLGEIYRPGIQQQGFKLMNSSHYLKTNAPTHWSYFGQLYIAIYNNKLQL